MKAGRVVATVNGSALPSPVSRLSGSFSIWGSVPPWPVDEQETEFVYQGWGEQKFLSIWQLKEEGGEESREEVVVVMKNMWDSGGSIR